MFLEAAIISTGYFIGTAITEAIFYEETLLKEQWRKTTEALNLEDFNIKKITKINNGFELIVNIPFGKSFESIEKYTNVFNDNLKSICTFENIRFTDKFKVHVITKDIGKYNFSPVKTTPNKLFIAREFNSNPYFVDLDKEGHILIAGQTGTGKSFILATVLTNLIYNNSEGIEIYLSQIMKGEIGLFSNCSAVKSTQYNLNEVAATLTKVSKQVDDRSKLFTSKGVKNLTHYNSKVPGKKLKRIFYIIEEVSFFIPNKEVDSDQTFALKQKCWESILTIAKAGRSSGVHFISVTQRSTVANIPSEVKAQMCCLTTKQRSGRDSENIIDVPDAKDLGDRELLIWGRNGLKLLKVPFVDEDFKDLQKYVKEIKLPNFEENNIKEVKTKESGLICESKIDMRVEEYEKLMSKKREIKESIQDPEVKKERKTRVKKGVKAVVD